MVLSADWVIEAVNPAFLAITGFSAKEAVGQRPDFLDPGQGRTEGWSEFKAALAGLDRWQGALAMRRKSGEVFLVWATALSVKDKTGQTANCLILFHDLAGEPSPRDSCRLQTHHDFLTGLPDRFLFRDRLDQALARAGRGRQKVALLFLDLDHFKRINDTLGHDAGDQLLQEVARRLKSCLRGRDTVARLGGDEFVMLVEEITGPGDAIHVARRVIDALTPTFNLKGHEFHVTTSIGVTLYPDDGQDAESLVKNADLAMYRTKEQGRNGYQLFTPELNAAATERLALELRLRQAMDSNEFRIHYQPRIALATGQIVGLEALLRWQKPGVGLAYPAEFIHLAEETGLIVPIGQWVFSQVAQRINAWQKSGWPSLKVSVNLSARQLKDPGLPEKIDRAIAEAGLEPAWLDLEVSEAAVMGQVENSLEILAKLKAKDCHMTMANFGSGYTALSLLKRLPLDAVKLDRLLIHDLIGDPQVRDIAAALIAMALKLERRVAADGVEKPEQLDFLKAHGCHEAQGFLFWPALPEAELQQVLTQNLSLCQNSSRI